MDIWAIIAVCIVVPAVVLLVTVAVVSALRMAKPYLQVLWISGLTMLPVLIACRWTKAQFQIGLPWGTILEIVGDTAGFIVAYAFIAALAVCVRNGMVREGGRANRKIDARRS